MKKQPKPMILVADDDDGLRLLLQFSFEKAGFQVLLAKDGREALSIMSDRVEVAVLDLMMPQMGGIECLEQIKADFPDTQVILMTGSREGGRTKRAVEAMKKGAFDYVNKPVDQEELIALIRQAARTSKLGREVHQLRSSFGSPAPENPFLGTSASAEKLSSQVEKVAELDSTVLITGESGVGKGLLARWIHASSPRHAAPFVTINCTALPRDLVETELFGHEKGAFTGAQGQRLGKVEIAEGGTIFLDEIGDMPLDLQPKLLSFLQDRVISRIGGRTEIPVDVRVVAATNQELKKMVAEGRFREDLYFRLNVLPLHIAPLRERREDIPLLASHFLRKIAIRRRVEPFVLSDDARDLMAAHSWPGNVRELENAMERASAFCEVPIISASDLPEEVRAPAPAAGSSATQLAGLKMSEIEQRAIEQTLESCGNNRTEAARMLGISERSIYNKIRQMGLPPVKSRS